jgi:Tfp pilus assembly PilM family ATPase
MGTILGIWACRQRVGFSPGGAHLNPSMLFAKKTKGYFVEMNENSVLLARTNSPSAPMEIEELVECALGDAPALADALKQLQPKRPPSGYLHAVVGVYPPRRIVRKHTLELKKMKEAAYMADLFTQQLRIEQDKFTVAMINATDGGDYDLGKANQKEVVFCGAPNEEINAVQQNLLNGGVFPERLELGSVATLGALVDYLSFEKSKTPTLVLDVGNDTTHSFIVSANGVEASRPIPQGLEAMVPVVQKELGLKDEESARKLFRSNTFDFTGMGPLLIKRLLKELQSSIGFYEVQTGQSVGQVICIQLSPKLSWLEGALASSLGIATLKFDPVPWLRSRQVIIPDALSKTAAEFRWFGLMSLMVQYSPQDGTRA